MKYIYRGVNRSQEFVEGTIEARDVVEVRVRLRSLNIIPKKISKSNFFTEFDWKKININFGNPIKLKILLTFFRQFSSLIDAGIPITQCLELLSEQEKKKQFKKILMEVKEDVASGASLAQSFDKHRHVFSELIIQTVNAGEISGTLDKAFRRLSMQMEKLGTLRKKVIGALTYPLFTLIVAIIVLIFLLVKVIPDIGKIYSEMNATLPDLTLQVLSLSKWVEDHYDRIIESLVSFGFIVYFLSKYERFRQIWDPFILKIPLLGSLIIKSAVASLARTLATLVSSGVPLISCFEIIVKIMTNRDIKNKLARVADGVNEGQTIAQGLLQTKIFPNMAIQMIHVGEITGGLDEMLSKIADIYDEEVESIIGYMTSLIQPIMIIVIGVLIAFLLIAMYLPIFSLATKMAS